MRRPRSASWTVALVAAVWLLLLHFGAHAYGLDGQSANAGFVVGDCYHFDVGIEVRGIPGPFINQC